MPRSIVGQERQGNNTIFYEEQPDGTVDKVLYSFEEGQLKELERQKNVEFNRPFQKPHDYEKDKQKETTGFLNTLEKLASLLLSPTPAFAEEGLAKSAAERATTKRKGAYDILIEDLKNPIKSKVIEWTKKYGIEDPYNPEHHYDYESAYKNKIEPLLWDTLPMEQQMQDLRQAVEGKRTGEPMRWGDALEYYTGKYMWPDEYKLEGHKIPPE